VTKIEDEFGDSREGLCVKGLNWLYAASRSYECEIDADFRAMTICIEKIVSI
jgi:hypothetical protein